MKNKVVITGIGMVSAQGLSIKDFRKKDGSEPLPVAYRTTWDAGDIGRQFHYKTPDFDIKEFFPELKAPYPLRYSQLAMIACKDAMEDAGLLDYAYNKARTGVMIDTAYGTNEAIERYLEKLEADGPRKVSPFLFSQTVSNVAVGYVARQFHLQGPSSLLFGESSLCYGYDIIQSGNADIMICGGVDNIRDNIFGLYQSNDLFFQCPDGDADTSDAFMGALADQYDKNRLAIGENAAVFLVLETWEHAQARGATVYAELLDYAVVQDQAFDHFISERNVADCAMSMQQVMKRCDIQPQDVGIVVGEASSPHMFDAMESLAIAAVWADAPVYYTSVKPFIGETFNASAQASVAFTADMLYRGVTKENPWKDLYRNTASVALDADSQADGFHTALVHTMQLGGNNTSFMLRAVG